MVSPQMMSVVSQCEYLLYDMYSHDNKVLYSTDMIAVLEKSSELWLSYSAPVSDSIWISSTPSPFKSMTFPHLYSSE